MRVSGKRPGSILKDNHHHHRHKVRARKGYFRQQNKKHVAVSKARPPPEHSKYVDGSLPYLHAIRRVRPDHRTEKRYENLVQKPTPPSPRRTNVGQQFLQPIPMRLVGRPIILAKKGKRKKKKKRDKKKGKPIVYYPAPNRRSVRSWIILFFSTILLILAIVITVLADMWIRKFRWVWVITLAEPFRQGDKLDSNLMKVRSADANVNVDRYDDEFMSLETVAWASLMAGIGGLILAIYGYLLFLTRSKVVLITCTFVVVSAIVCSGFAIHYLFETLQRPAQEKIRYIMRRSMLRYQGPNHRPYSSIILDDDPFPPNVSEIVSWHARSVDNEPIFKDAKDNSIHNKDHVHHLDNPGGLQTYGDVKKSRYLRRGRNDRSIAWNRLQKMFDCCGLDSWEDWSKESQDFRNKTRVPKSCCTHQPGTNLCVVNPSEHLQMKPGCWNKLYKYVSERTTALLVLLWITISVKGILLLIFLSLLCMCTCPEWCLPGEEEPFVYVPPLAPTEKVINRPWERRIYQKEPRDDIFRIVRIKDDPNLRMKPRKIRYVANER